MSIFKGDLLSFIEVIGHETLAEITRDVLELVLTSTLGEPSYIQSSDGLFKFSVIQV